MESSPLQIVRTTAATVPEGTTLFLIGMRVRKPWHVISWFRTAIAMPRMLAYLARTPEAGLLSYDLYLGRSALVVSYWRDAEALRTFAANTRAPHAKAWRWFNKQVAPNGSVGVWHETYVIGAHEEIYSSMPPFGLSKAVGAEPVETHSRTAKQRLAATV